MNTRKKVLLAAAAAAVGALVVTHARRRTVATETYTLALGFDRPVNSLLDELIRKHGVLTVDGLNRGSVRAKVRRALDR